MPFFCFFFPSISFHSHFFFLLQLLCRRWRRRRCRTSWKSDGWRTGGKTIKRERGRKHRPPDGRHTGLHGPRERYAHQLGCPFRYHALRAGSHQQTQLPPHFSRPSTFVFFFVLFIIIPFDKCLPPDPPRDPPSSNIIIISPLCLVDASQTPPKTKQKTMKR